MSGKTQLMLDFASKNQRSVSFQLRRAVMGWLLPQQPVGMAVDVPCLAKGLRLDVAAFWNESVRLLGQRGRSILPRHTVGVICCTDRDGYFKACMAEPDVARQLQELHVKMHEREGQIQQNEPELRERGTLFEEYASWNYSGTKDAEYRQWLELSQRLEKMMRHGTKVERLSKIGMLSEVYIAVPEKTISAEEALPGCGLLWIDRHLKVTLVKDAIRNSCKDAAQILLVQKIAAASMEAEVSMHGLGMGRNAKVKFTIPPRVRHKIDNPWLAI